MTSATFAARPVPAPEPSLADDLAALVSQGQALDADIAAIDLTAGSGCTELGLAATSLGDWLTAAIAVQNGINTPFSVDSASLDSLDNLSSLTFSMASQIKSMSMDLTTISSVTELAELDTMLAAMLRLSTDIGAMADRIGEMADRILIMADNIGLMADRMLITQQLQSANVIAVQNAMLVTQQNAVALSGSINTLVYNTELATLVTQASALSASMDMTSLNTLSMATQLAWLEGAAATYLAQLNVLYSQMMNDSAFASQYINGDTLTMAEDLSTIHRALAFSLDAFADDVNRLAPITWTSVLSSATDSMLVLSRDIGTMSDRIMEMVDRIVVMADNIGDMSTRIVATQNLQQSNVEFTQASLLTATTTTVNVIAAYGL
jgi:hypothetical protein